MFNSSEKRTVRDYTYGSPSFDCLGLSQQVYGTPGPYIQSDMQFSLQVFEDLRAFDRIAGMPGDGLLDEKLSLKLETRFYSTAPFGMVASRAQLEYGNEFLKQIYAMEGLNFADHTEDEILPTGVSHGFHFNDYYVEDDTFEMINSELESVLFDRDGFWAGFRFMNRMTGQSRIDSPFGDNITSLEEKGVLQSDHKTTRLVGLRTTKRCQSDKKIMSVQPIFYSVDEMVCNKFLTPLTEGDLQEIPEHGPQCSDMLAINLQESMVSPEGGASTEVENTKTVESRDHFHFSLQVATAFGIFGILLMVVVMLYMEISMHKERNKNLRALKQIQLHELRTGGKAARMATDADMLGTETQPDKNEGPPMRIEDAVDQEKA